MALRTLVTQHQRNRKQPELTAYFSFHSRIEFFETVDEHQCQEDDVLGYLCHR